mmetsp:Transcript_16465/g.15791  ORF Transcript_16465/g.15791 Transcript_16465/m.15791 type:complete len:90 (-) Transcript_16465:1327-1596(-)
MNPITMIDTSSGNLFFFSGFPPGPFSALGAFFLSFFEASSSTGAALGFSNQWNRALLDIFLRISDTPIAANTHAAGAITSISLIITQEK